MSSSDERPSRPWHANDRTALLVGSLLSALLLVLWLTGSGPWDQQACHSETTKEITKEVTEETRGLHLDLEHDGGKVVLYGAVANAADRQSLIDAAEASFGRDNVDDRLTVDALVAPLTWAGSAKDLFATLKAIDERGRFKIDGDVLTASGFVADAASKDSHAGAAAAILGATATLRNDIEVRSPPPSPGEVKREPPPPPTPEPAPVVTAPPEAVPVLINGLMKHTLPNGVVIDVAPDGVERKCIAFFEDKSKPVDKGLWFDFDRLYFHTASSNLTAESKSQVQSMVEVLKAYPGTAIKIGGYTDNVGDPDFNLKLSHARAERVMKELIALGVAPDRLESEGYGEQHPQADNATEEGRAKNRRTAVSVRRK